MKSSTPSLNKRTESHEKGNGETVLTLFQKARVFRYLQYRSFENTVRKRKIARD